MLLFFSSSFASSSSSSSFFTSSLPICWFGIHCLLLYAHTHVHVHTSLSSPQYQQQLPFMFLLAPAHHSSFCMYQRSPFLLFRSRTGRAGRTVVCGVWRWRSGWRKRRVGREGGIDELMPPAMHCHTQQSRTYDTIRVVRTWRVLNLPTRGSLFGVVGNRDKSACLPSLAQPPSCTLSTQPRSHTAPSPSKTHEATRTSSPKLL